MPSYCDKHSTTGFSPDHSEVSSEVSSSESIHENTFLECEHTRHRRHYYHRHRGCERETSTHYTTENGVEISRTVSTSSCSHSSFSHLANHLMSLTSSAQSGSRHIDLTVNFSEKSHRETFTSGDRAPFPAANPPAGVESSTVSLSIFFIFINYTHFPKTF